MANPHGMKLSDIAFGVAGELCGCDAPVAHSTFLVSRFGSQLHRPERPRGLRRTLVGRFGHDLKLMNRERLLAMTSAEAVSAGVAATDDDDALSRGKNFNTRIDDVAQAALVLLWKEFHCVVNSLQLAAGNFQVARVLGAAGENDSLIFAAEILDWNFRADFGVGYELHPLGGHLIEAAVDDVFFQLELRDAVAKQSTDAVSFFVDGDGMAGAAQLLGCRESRRT